MRTSPTRAGTRWSPTGNLLYLVTPTQPEAARTRFRGSLARTASSPSIPCIMTSPTSHECTSKVYNRLNKYCNGLEHEMEQQHTVKAVVRRGERYYVAECVELAVVTQGKTVDETLANLREAVALHLEGEDPASFGLAPNPTILVTMELEPARA